MKTVKTKKELQEFIKSWKAKNLTISFVPTMGALHEGHLSLVKLALEKADRCVASVFVNPAQFAPHEDFSTYPREEEKDLAGLEEAGAHLVYLPGVEEIYPAKGAKGDGVNFTPSPGEAAQGLETDFRPHFFDGVLTVVHRLFQQVQPDIAVFGEKDFQQLQVIREMVEVQNMPIQIIGAPIMRDEHGLALSSRNAYLSDAELQTARQLNKVLSQLSSQAKATPKALFDSLETNKASLCFVPRDLTHHDTKPDPSTPLCSGRDDTDTFETAKTALLEAGFTKIDYIAEEKRWNRLLAAVWIGKTRLIDNMEI